MSISRASKVVLWVVGLCALLSLGASIFLTSTAAGRRWIADRAEHFVSDAIPGSLRIGKLVDLGPPLIAEDVRFYHPDGRVVLLAKYAEVVFDMAEAFHGRLAFARAKVDGGHIDLSMDPDDRVAFEAAVDEPSKPGEPSDPNGGLHYALQSMHVQNFLVKLKLSKDADFSVHDVEGFVGVRRIETSATRVLLDGISGRVEPKIVGTRLTLRRVDGWIRGKEQHVMHFDAKTKIGTGTMDAIVDYYNREKTPVELVIQKAEGTGELVKGLLSLGSDLFGDALKVTVND